VIYPAASNLTAYAEHVATRTFSTLQLVADEEFSRHLPLPAGVRSR
jgi:hypothetical protein